MKLILCSYSNVVLLCTSNVTEAIDGAFLSRADLVKYIGPPGVPAIYSILAAATNELFSVYLVL